MKSKAIITPLLNRLTTIMTSGKKEGKGGTEALATSISPKDNNNQFSPPSITII